VLAASVIAILRQQGLTALEFCDKLKKLKSLNFSNMKGSLYFTDSQGNKTFIGKLVNVVVSIKNKGESKRVIWHRPDRDKLWWFGFHPEKGRLGRIRWFNSDQEEGSWGRVFLSRNP
jgi:hypothetical protein